jgi:hypothetical protein
MKKETAYQVIRISISLAIGLMLGGFLAGMLMLHSDAPINLIWVLWAVLFLVIARVTHLAIVGLLGIKRNSSAN